MEKRMVLFVAVFLVAQLFGVAVAPAAAEGNMAPAGAYAEGNLVLDSATMETIAELGVQMQNHLILNPDGTLALGEVDPVALNVSAEYVENYKMALQYINAAVKQGLFTIDENFQVSWAEDAFADTETPKEAEPAWGSYPTSSGLYVNFSYSDVRYYVPRYGLTTATSLASYTRRPYIATPYVYHFTYQYNYNYYYRYSYPSYGVWSYVPWGYLPYYSSRTPYYPSYKYIYYWYPYGRYYYYPRCYY